MTYACNKRIVEAFMIYDFWLCGYPSIWRTATDKYWELNGIDMLRYLLLLMRVALQVCEPHTALDFPEKNGKKYQKVKPYTQIYMFKLQFSARKFPEDPQNK